MTVEYTTQYSDSLNWFRQAREMFIVSKILRDDFMARRKNPPRTEEMLECSAGLIKGTMFFLGISIENALKGVCIGIVENEKSIRSHNLRKLAGLARLNLSQEEIDLLDRLTIYIKWAGRYHVPLEKNADQLNTSLRMTIPNDFRIAEKMLVSMKVFGD
jgi:hypothetical protein